MENQLAADSPTPPIFSHPKYKLTTGRWPASQGLGNTDIGYGLELADSTPICTAGVCAHQQPAHAEPRNRPPITSSTSAPPFPHPTIWTSKTQTPTQWAGCSGLATLPSRLIRKKKIMITIIMITIMIIYPSISHLLGILTRWLFPHIFLKHSILNNYATCEA